MIMGIKQRLSVLREARKQAEGEIPESKGELVVIKDGQAVTSSREVAARFEKDHKNILQMIQDLDCSAELRELNFQLSFYEVETGNGTMRQYPMYYVTRDGFTFLVMGFNGPKAALFKEKYIAAFNVMEKKLMGAMTGLLSKEDGMKVGDRTKENLPTFNRKLASIKV